MFIANRTLKLSRDGIDSEVAIRISAPQPDQGAWSCACEIDWPEGTRKFAIRGVDSVQALELALKMIGSTLYTSEYHKSKVLTWDKPGNGYGFPVPATIRDLLEGDDAKYF